MPRPAISVAEYAEYTAKYTTEYGSWPEYAAYSANTAHIHSKAARCIQIFEFACLYFATLGLGPAQEGSTGWYVRWRYFCGLVSLVTVELV